ncbi:MAG: DUF3429 domain-containing protein [Pseudomonadota bacterium]
MALSQTSGPTVPRTPLLLGYLGLLPFFFGALAVWALPGTLERARILDIYTAQLYYGAVILSFMGGVRWGLATATENWGMLAASVLPALIAWFALWPFGLGGIELSAVLRLSLLIVAFLGLLYYDVKAARSGAAPSWYALLRLRLTFYVVIFLAATLMRLASWGYY